LLPALITVYIVLGVAYAWKTPAWQAPDEPAHYNYVRAIVEERALPELKDGDYAAQYLELIKKWRFPPDRDVDRIRYESHQPPLYYVLSAAPYALATALGLPTLLILRLFSVLLGACALVFGYKLVIAVDPDSRLFALGAVGYAATLPMHVAVTASVNNDVMTELVLVFAMWQMLRGPLKPWSHRRAVGIGLVLGLALLTKMQAYIMLPMAALVMLYDHRWPLHREQRNWRKLMITAGISYGVALLVALPWFIRNMSLYGIGDPLGMRHHAQVVVGQLTTAEYVSLNGLTTFVRNMVVTTFQSYLGQFGWMGVVLHFRFYMAWLAIVGMSFVGLVVYALRARTPQDPIGRSTMRGVLLLIVWPFLTLAGFLWYNTQFLQFQGRYLFPAILPLGLAFTIGWIEIIRSRPRRTLLIPVAMAIVLVAIAVRSGDVKEFTLAMTALLALALWGGNQAERRLPGIALWVLYAAMAAFSAYCLVAYIVPQLTY